MASTCPKCHQVIEEDDVCCAEVRYTWKCKNCGKLSTGFVVPYGRCFLCGGEHDVIQGYSGAAPDQVDAVRAAFQLEVDMYQFYRIARERTSDTTLRAVLEELCFKELDHINDLESKYHVHHDPGIRDLPQSTEALVSQWIFSGLDFSDAAMHVLAVYDKAIVMEQRTRDYFLALAAKLEPGSGKELFRELAAEEEDHVTMLETEREQFLNK
jgi:glutamate synthase (NADPH/NADH) small chain